MRIRKHARNSSAGHTPSSLQPGTVLQTYDCQLNQSPWDVMSFSPPSSPPPPSPPPPPQVSVEDSCGGNGCSDRHHSLVERANRRDMIETNGCYKDELFEKELLKSTNNGEVILCCKNDGKSWHCRREAAQGSSLCGHHLSLSKNYQNSAHTKKSGRAMEPRRSTRSTNKVDYSKSNSSSSDSNEFYYYFGFRPGWSKKIRSNNGGVLNYSGIVSERNETTSSLIVNGHDYREVSLLNRHEAQNDVVEEEDRGNGRKRIRKPVKERSLKSLIM
ncbi:uncharacterized protein LOC127258773 isoform X2 [Andrographis paniculata]|uniref:uncharacterized protein LOC127258773 isoform X2 n=1 Tax=Andrographis paniculata TaxID=175694 RepID=UPI0021E85B01|nr:uncharacterized protein LOC127258773 isoform X2 [Andrographis paniculata]